LIQKFLFKKINEKQKCPRNNNDDNNDNNPCRDNAAKFDFGKKISRTIGAVVIVRCGCGDAEHTWQR
jgi:hypothetical protein